jgi:hypothetical protein
LPCAQLYFKSAPVAIIFMHDSIHLQAA